MDPVRIVALLQIGLQSPVNSLLRVDCFLNPLPANPGEPAFHRFGVGRGNRLDNAQKLLCIRSIGQPHFSIWCSHFQLYDIFVQFICTLHFQFALQIAPIPPGILASRQHTDYIYNGEIPLLLLLIPGGADGLVLKTLDLVLLTHNIPVLSDSLSALYLT